MAVDPMNMSPWFTDSISVAAISSLNSYGQPTYAAAATVLARVESARRLVKNVQGQESVASHVIHTTTAISLSDRIWLPGVSSSDANLAKVPLSVSSNHDRNGGYTLYEVLLGG